MRILIVLNGPPPQRQLVRSLAAAADVRIAADAGAGFLLAAGIAPDAVVGDLDSLAPAVRRRLGAGTLRHDPGQDDTDADKALRHAARHWPGAQVVVLGDTGGRLDHLLGVVGIAFRHAPTFQRLTLRFGDQWARPVCAGRPEILSGLPAGGGVSLWPYGRAVGARIDGVTWPLRGATLDASSRGISNRALGRQPVTVSCDRGRLLVLWDAMVGGVPTPGGFD